MSDIINIKTVTEAHKFLNLPKPKHPLVSVIWVDGSTFKEEHKDLRLTADYYFVSLKDGITGSFGYGRNTYDFHEGTLIFIAPGQVLSGGEKENLEEVEGWMLIFHPDLIRKSALGKHIEDYSFFSYDVHEALHMSDEEKQTLTDLVQKIEKETSLNIDRHSQKLIVSNIELLLDYCTRYYDRQFYTRTNLNKDVTIKFEELLKNYYKSDKPLEMGVPTVKYCGAELHMSPNYLSDLLKKETGKNAQ